MALGTRNGGGLTWAQLRASVARDSFSQYLPLVAWDKDEECFITSDDCYGYAYEFVPAAYMFPHVRDAIRGLLNIQFEKGTTAQLQIFADPMVDHIIAAFGDLKTRDDPLVQASTKQAQKFLSEGRAGLKALNGVPIRDFRGFLWLKSRRRMNPDLRRQVEEQLAKLGIERQSPEEVVRHCRRVFNGIDTDQPGVFSSDIERGGRVLPIRKQIIEAGPPLLFEGSELFIGNHVARCLTPLAPARRIDAVRANKLLGGMMGSGDDSDQIGGPFLYTLTILFDHSNSDIHARAQILSAQKAAGSFAIEVAKQGEEIAWILDEQGNNRFVKVIPTLWVFGKTRDQTREMAARVKRLWESEPNPWKMQEESYLNPTLLTMSLPFGVTTDKATVNMLERDFTLSVNAAALLAPVQSDFRGGGRPMLAFAGRKEQLVTLDLFDSRNNNFNFIISAESGAGKSFLLNNLVFQYYASGALVRIVDIGGSYRKMCTLCSGRYIDIGEEKLVLNPFDQGFALDDEDRASALTMAVTVMAEMVNAAARKGVSNSEWNLLKAATEWTIQSGRAERGIDAVREYLGTYPKYARDEFDNVEGLVDTAKQLAFNLRDFATGGSYGQFFNGKSTFDITSDEFVVLELEKLKSLTDLFNVMVMQVVNSVTQELYLSDRDKPRFVLCDEAAQFMATTGGQDLSRLGAIFNEGYRRARKYYGSFGTVLQSMNDLLLFGGTGQVILENAATRFLLQGTTYDKAVANKVLDYEGFVLELLKSVKNQKPNYSEVFIHSPTGLGVARLVVDPFSYWINTSSASEVAAFDRLVRSGLKPLEAVCKLAGVDPREILAETHRSAPLLQAAE